MARRKVTVFGGTGFLGRRVVRHLLEHDFSVRVAARHPERISALFPNVPIRTLASLAAALTMTALAASQASAQSTGQDEFGVALGAVNRANWYGA